MAVLTTESEFTIARRRMRRRWRALLAMGLVGALAWAAISFVADAGTSGATVGTVPGVAADGSIANITALADSVTRPGGGANLQAGVKFARIDVAETYHRAFRASLSWMNPTDFKKTSQVANWQIRFGVYYPVHNGSCTGTDTSTNDDALSVTVPDGAIDDLDADPDTICVYRDLSAAGPRVTTASGNAHRGTQLLATDVLVGELHPKIDQSGAAACGGSGTTPCLLFDTPGNNVSYFVIGSLLNPAGHVPPGQSDSIEPMQIHVQAKRIARFDDN